MKKSMAAPIATQTIAGICANDTAKVGTVRISGAKRDCFVLIFIFSIFIRDLYTKNITAKLIRK